MREIKFRAWDTLNKRFCENRSFISLTGTSYDGPGFATIISMVAGVVMPLMQYTGLKDKNGEEIYEGDIVYLSGYGNYIVEWPFIQLFESSWEDDIGDIIGNVYEDPELIKER
jgi:hypothetical protein